MLLTTTNYKEQEEHPRSTVTRKQKGIRHDTNNGRVRLSKGANHKEHPQAWEYILVEYETRPGVTVENLQQVRAVYDEAKGRWELHLVCKHEVETPDTPGDETAGVDLGICNFAAIAYSTEETDLYPGNRLKQDGYYFPKRKSPNLTIQAAKKQLDCTRSGQSVEPISFTP
jgi:putative transposase